MEITELRKKSMNINPEFTEFVDKNFWNLVEIHCDRCYYKYDCKIRNMEKPMNECEFYRSKKKKKNIPSKLIMDNVINKVYKKLYMLSMDEFKNRLNKHRNGTIAKIVKETNREKNNK